MSYHKHYFAGVQLTGQNLRNDVFYIPCQKLLLLAFKSSSHYENARASKGLSVSRAAQSVIDLSGGAVMYVVDYIKEHQYCIEITSFVPKLQYSYIAFDSREQLLGWLQTLGEFGVRHAVPGGSEQSVHGYKVAARSVPSQPALRAISGFLEKKGKFNTSFQNRLFRVQFPPVGPPVLQYFKTSFATEPKGTIVLDRSSAVQPDNDQRVFSIRTPKRTYTVRARSAELRQQWVDALRAVIAESSRGARQLAIKTGKALCLSSSLFTSWESKFLVLQRESCLELHHSERDLQSHIANPKAFPHLSSKVDLFGATMCVAPYVDSHDFNLEITSYRPKRRFCLLGAKSQGELDTVIQTLAQYGVALCTPAPPFSPEVVALTPTVWVEPKPLKWRLRGFLDKRGEKNTAFQKRFFRFHGSTDGKSCSVAYYKSVTDAKPKGGIPLVFVRPTPAASSASSSSSASSAPRASAPPPMNPAMLDVPDEKSHQHSQSVYMPERPPLQYEPSAPPMDQPPGFDPLYDTVKPGAGGKQAPSGYNPMYDAVKPGASKPSLYRQRSGSDPSLPPSLPLQASAPPPEDNDELLLAPPSVSKTSSVAAAPAPADSKTAAPVKGNFKAVVERQVPKAKPANTAHLQFAVRCPTRTYTLMARSKQEKDAWIAVLSTVIANGLPEFHDKPSPVLYEVPDAAAQHPIVVYDHEDMKVARQRQESTERLCVFCQERPPDHAVMDCLHVCLCAECAELYKQPDKTCPICRQPVRAVKRLYFS